VEGVGVVEGAEAAEAPVAAETVEAVVAADS